MVKQNNMNCASLREEIDTLKKRINATEHYNDGLKKEIIELSKTARSISENLAMIDEIKKGPADLIHQKIIKTMKKYDEEISPKVEKLNRMRLDRIAKANAKLNTIYENFCSIAAYSITFDKFMDKKKNDHSHNETARKSA